MPTIASALLACKQYLQEHQTEVAFNAPHLEARILLAYVMGLDNTGLITRDQQTLTKQQESLLQECMTRRTGGEPIAYIVGEQAFWTLELWVSTDTLIPRSDSEIIVETAIGLPLPEHANVVDLGTGTGAIALAIKSERATWQVQGIDFLSSVVELAQRNATRNGLDVAFSQSDWFTALGDQRFDLIVSNPPYVEQDSEWLKVGDVRFEPDTALTAKDEGLADIKHIVAQAPKHLNSQGYLLLEHGFQQADQVVSLMQSAGFIDVQVLKDIQGLDRGTLGRVV